MEDQEAQNCKKTLKKAKRNGRTEFVGGLQERKPEAEVLTESGESPADKKSPTGQMFLL